MKQISTINNCLEIVQGMQTFLKSLGLTAKEHTTISSFSECLIASEEINMFLQKTVGAKEQIDDVHALQEIEEYLTQITRLRGMLVQDRWPAAMDPSYICDLTLERDKNDRAVGILETLVKTNLKNKKFLDYGCGEGHVVLKALEQDPILAIGYDIKQLFSTNPFLTTEFEEVEDEYPFDIILLHDVIDHIIGDPISILKKVKTLLANNGSIIMRCHPWCSRHGGHLYHQKNKAFLHLVFSSDELRKLGVTPDNSIQKVTDPHRIYKEWIKEAGLKIINEDVIKSPVEDFFHHSLISRRINQSCQRLPEQELAVSHMEQSFIDYTLKKLK